MLLIFLIQTNTTIQTSENNTLPICKGHMGLVYLCSKSTCAIAQMQNTKDTKREHSQRISHNVSLSLGALMSLTQHCCIQGKAVLECYVQFWRIQGPSHLGPNATFNEALCYPIGSALQKNWNAKN